MNFLKIDAFQMHVDLTANVEKLMDKLYALVFLDLLELHQLADLNV